MKLYRHIVHTIAVVPWGMGIALVFVVAGHLKLIAQSDDALFGKNRVQYSDDFDARTLYYTDHFTVYWYGKSRVAATKVIAMVEQEYKQMKELLEFPVSKPIDVLVFADMTDLKQTNIGVEEAFEWKSSLTPVVDNKVFVYYTGRAGDMRRQLRQGMATVMFRWMMYGDFLKEVLQSTYFIALPKWLEEGLISFCGVHWDEIVDAHVQRAFERGWLEEDFSQWAKREPRWAGHAFWFYLYTQYGARSIPDILYLLRVDKDIHTALLYSLGMEWEGFYNNMAEYYRKRYEKLLAIAQKPILEPPLYTANTDGSWPIVTSFAPIDHRGALLVGLNQSGKRTVWQITNKHKKRLFKKGYKNIVQPPDVAYPQVVRIGDSTIAILNEQRDVLYLYLYKIDGQLQQRHVVRPEIQRIYHMVWVEEIGMLLLTANLYGASDVVLYNLWQRQFYPLTEDYWDDWDASICRYRGRLGVCFVSNRGDSLTLRKQRTPRVWAPSIEADVYFLSWNEDYLPDEEVIRLTHDGRMKYMPLLQGDTLYYLANHLGKRSLYMYDTTEDGEGRATTKVLFADRNISRINLESGSLLLQVDRADETQIYSAKAYRNGYLLRKDATNVGDTGNAQEGVPSRDVRGQKRYDPFNFFDSEFAISNIPDSLRKLSIDEIEEILEWFYPIEEEQSPKPETFSSVHALAYIDRYYFRSLKIKMDNADIVDSKLAWWGGANALSSSIYRPMGLHIQLPLVELFNDYTIALGARLTPSLNGLEVYLRGEDRHALWDKSAIVYVQKRRYPQSRGIHTTLYQTQSILLQYGVKYPFNVFGSVRVRTTFRNDRQWSYATDEETLRAPIVDAQRLGVRVEYVFDNTWELAMNLRGGTRLHVGIEWLKRMQIDNHPWSFEILGPWTLLWDWDVRHYFVLPWSNVIALRWAGAMNTGSERILYILGGTINELYYRLNESFYPSEDQRFSYVMVRPPLRGFPYNQRNGNAFSLLNVEWRVPVGKYLMRGWQRWAFLRHLQVVGFGDAGVAWNGVSPFDERNYSYVRHYQNPAVELRVRYYTEPFLLGYGVGLRTYFLGYFLRLDYAWGVQDRVVQRPRFHFALGLDF